MGDLSSSPKPNSVDFVVSFITIDSISSERVFSEAVLKVSDVSVLQVVGQVANNSLSFVLDVLDFPD